MPNNPSLLYYGAMGAAIVICFFAALNYLRLSSQIARSLDEHSAEWRLLKSGPPDFMVRPSPRGALSWIIFNCDPRQMLPSDPSVQIALRQARIAGFVFIIGLGVALVCLGAADAGSRYR